MKKATAFHPRVTRRFTRERGASLLEGIAYLGIAAIVVLGAVSLLTNAFGNAKANQTTEELIALRTAVRKLYAGQPYNTDAFMQANLVTANAIPNTLVRGAANAIANSWAGTVTIAGTTASTFTITYSNVPQDVCVAIISGATGWTSIAANGNTPAITAFPATTSLATTHCSVAGNNTVVFTAT
ncbi:MAG TPA: type 4 pilus major pilin [Noviherbaspirillum sp.]